MEPRHCCPSVRCVTVIAIILTEPSDKGKAKTLPVIFLQRDGAEGRGACV